MADDAIGQTIAALLALKPFLEAHHCRTDAIDKAVEMLRGTIPRPNR